MNLWLIAILIYSVLVILTFIPVFVSIVTKIKLKDAGSSTNESSILSDKSKERLEQNHSRMNGTLLFWKKQATTQAIS